MRACVHINMKIPRELLVWYSRCLKAWIYLSVLCSLKITFKDLKIIIWHFFSEGLQTLFKEFKTKAYQMPWKHRKSRNCNGDGRTRGRKRTHSKLRKSKEVKSVWQASSIPGTSCCISLGRRSLALTLNYTLAPADEQCVLLEELPDLSGPCFPHL